MLPFTMLPFTMLTAPSSYLAFSYVLLHFCYKTFLTSEIGHVLKYCATVLPTQCNQFDNTTLINETFD